MSTFHEPDKLQVLWGASAHRNTSIWHSQKLNFPIF